jgi:hypothetical protein
MAFVLADRVRDTTTTTGTGTVTLSGTAPTGYQTFGDGIGNGNNTYYTINADSQWEVGIGTYTASGTTLARNTVLASSNGGALVDFALGVKDVFVTYPAEKAVTDVYGTALAATTAANIGGGAAGSIPYQTAANTTSLLAAGTGVLIGGATPSYTMSPSLTQVTVAGDPTVNLQVATKQYVDTQTSAGIHYHQPVRVESPINLNATYNNGTAGVGATLTNAGTQAALVIDGVTVSVNDRVLIYEQTDETQNGIYDVTSVGSGSTNWVLTRSSDADTYVNASPDGLSQGSTVFVQQGTTGAGETYTCNTVGTITFGTTAITFAQISSAQIYSAGTGLTLTGTTFSLTSPVATSLGGTGLTTFTSGGAVYATSASVLTTGTLPATAGGTGQSSYTAGDLLYATSATTLGVIADVATGNALISGGAGADPSYGKIGLTTHISGTLAVGNGGTGATSLTGYLVGNGTSAFTTTATIPTSDLSGTISLTTQVSGTLSAGNGGTGISSYTVGDILYASGTTTLASLADVATGNALISGGVSNAPLWGKIGLTTHVSGTLPVSNGGSGATTLTGYLKGNGTSAFTASATIPSGDITGAALTKADDTNVTLTLGGSPSTALLAATSITAGWSGQLAVSRGGTGNSTLASGYLLKGNGVSPTSASVVYDDGTNVGVGTASVSGTYGKLTVAGGVRTVDDTSSKLELGRFSAGAPNSYIKLGANSGSLRFTNAADDTDLMTLTNAGNLGLGTASPTAIGGYKAITLDAGTGTFTDYRENGTLRLRIGGDAGAGFINGSSGTLRLLTSDTDRLTINSSGNVTANVDMRAPIFYDSNNTGYYVDPNSTSVLFNLTISGGGNKYLQIQSTDSGEAMVRYLGATGPSWYVGKRTTSQLVDTASFHFYSESAGATVAGIDVSGNMFASGSMRAPIFYDNNNTAFYADMASTSEFNTIQTRGGSGFRTFAAGSASISSQLYFANAGNTRAWNWQLDENNNAALWHFTGAAWARKLSIVHGGDGQVAVPSFIQMDNSYSTTPLWDSLKFYLYKDSTQSYGIGLGSSADVQYWSGASSNGVHRFYTSRTMQFEIGPGGACSATGDLRAPIFYDSNNTGYYVDPNSISSLWGVAIRGDNSASATENQIFFWGPGNTTTSAIGFKASAGAFPNPTGQGDGYNTYLTMDSAGRGWVFRRGVGGSDFSAAFTSGWILNNGIWQAQASMRSPIFYDSDNTSFYLDPGTTGISGMINGEMRFGGGGSSSVITSDGDFYSRRKSSTSTGVYYFADGGVKYLYWDGGRYYFGNAGPTDTDVSFRAPIFYDSNDTGYYVDPNTTATSFRGRGQIFLGPNSSSRYLRLGGDGGTSDHSTVSTSNGNLHIDSQSGYDLYLNWYSARPVWSEGGAYFPIYYDRNNTGYYLDPASGSYLFAVTMANLLTGASSASTDVNSANDTGSFSVRGSTTTVASMSFHRTGAYAINMGLGTDNVFRIGGWSASSNCFQMDGVGNLTMLGNVTAYSDARIKKDVTTIDGALDLISKMRGVRYTRIDTEKPGTGVIAQEMLEVMPEVVQQGVGDDDTLSVAYGNLVGVLIEAIKELEARVAELEGK